MYYSNCVWNRNFKTLSFYVNTQGTGEVEDLKFKSLENIVDLTPKGIRDHLALNNPIYVLFFLWSLW